MPSYDDRLLLQHIQDLQSGFIVTPNKRTFFDELLSHLLKLSNSEFGFIGEVLHNENGSPYLKVYAISNIAGNDKTCDLYLNNTALDLEFSDPKSLIGEVLTTQHVIISNNPADDPHRTGLPPGWPPLNNFLGLPLHNGGKMVGMAGVANHPSGYQQSLVDWLQPLTSTYGAIIIGHNNELRRQQAEQALQQRESLLSGILNTIVDAIISIDETGHILRFNPAAESMFGYSENEVIGKNIKMLMPSPYTEEHDQYLKNFLTSGQAKIIGIGREVQGLRKNKNIFPIELAVSELMLDGKRIFNGVIRDITLRKAAEKSLQINQQRLAEAQRLAHIGNWEWNIAQDSAECSDELYRILGLAPEETNMSLHTFIQYVHPHDRELVEKTLADTINGSQPTYSIEHRIIRQDGEERCVAAYGEPTKENGVPISMFGTLQDITERKVMDRMKDEFVSTVSHELRTPLTAIRGSLDLLKGNAIGTLPEEATAMVKIAYNNTERLLMLINDILHISKLESGIQTFRLQEIDLNKFLQQAIEANQPYASQHSIKLKLHNSPTISINADSNRLMQVMYNLISNAVKFSKPGQQVDIKTIHINGQIRVDIIDKGAGIPPEFRSTIFEKFTQADSSDSRRVSGTGLGLSIAKAIIEYHQGKLDFTSELGKGTHFFFTLPIVRTLKP